MRYPASEKLEIIRALMVGYDYSDYESNALKLLPGAMNHILGLPNPGNGQLDGKKRFLDAMLPLSKAFSLCNVYLFKLNDIQCEVPHDTILINLLFIVTYFLIIRLNFN